MSSELLSLYEEEDEREELELPVEHDSRYLALDEEEEEEDEEDEEEEPDDESLRLES